MQRKPNGIDEPNYGTKCGGWRLTRSRQGSEQGGQTITLQPCSARSASECNDRALLIAQAKRQIAERNSEHSHKAESPVLQAVALCKTHERNGAAK
jgi:hypothetical protein